MRSILQRIADGDERAITACLDEYGDLVWRLGSRYLNRATGEIEDAVQEVFIELWLSANRFDPAKGGEAAFVATIAHRRFTDYQRRVTTRRRVTRSAEANADRSPPSEIDRLAKDEREAEAIGVLRSLPEDERHALWLWLYRGLTHREISVATGAPIGTIKSRLRRALLRISDEVGAEVEHETERTKGGVS